MRHLMLAAVLLCVAPATRAAEPVSLEEFLKSPSAPPSAGLSYGPSPSQGIDVFLPAGAGPHPVLLLIHGGCWQANIPGREQLRHIGADLAKRGIAVWSIGYRRADEAGGGYPGMYQDVGAAVDRVRTEAKRFNLDLKRAAIAGHSAGGHLALWAAGRAQIPASSPLRTRDPFIPGTVISLAGVGDLKAEDGLVRLICAPGIADKLVGAKSAARPDVYADTSPAALLPNAPRKVQVTGVYDDTVPPYVALDYDRAARKAGQATTIVNMPDAGHLDMVTLGTPSWAEVVRQIEAALAR